MGTLPEESACEQEGLTTLQPRPADREQDARTDNDGKANAARCACIGGAVCTPIALVIVAILVRHSRRSTHLEPLLNLISESNLCLDSVRGACALNISDAEAARFDLHERDSPLLGFVYGQVVNKKREDMRQFLSGAYLSFQDANSSMYDMIRELPGAYKRISSHSSTNDMYGVPAGSVLSAALVGTLPGQTWLQLEGAPWDPRHKFWASMGHVLDFLEYVTVRRNVGPLGTSWSTDRHPLLHGTPLPTAVACLNPCDTGASLRRVAALAEFRPGVPPTAEAPHGIGLKLGSGGGRGHSRVLLLANRRYLRRASPP